MPGFKRSCLSFQPTIEEELDLEIVTSKTLVLSHGPRDMLVLNPFIFKMHKHHLKLQSGACAASLADGINRDTLSLRCGRWSWERMYAQTQAAEAHLPQIPDCDPHFDSNLAYSPKTAGYEADASRSDMAYEGPRNLVRALCFCQEPMWEVMNETEDRICG